MRHAISATTEWKNSDRTNSSPARSNPHRQAGITHQRKEKINPRPDEPPFLHTEPREEPRAGGGSIGGRVGGETTVLGELGRERLVCLVGPSTLTKKEALSRNGPVLTGLVSQGPL